MEGKSIWELIQTGGPVMYVLIVCSIVSIGISIERFIFYWRNTRVKRVELLESIKEALGKRSVPEAVEVCEFLGGPLARVCQAGLDVYAQPEEEIASAMEREITIQTTQLERYTTILATLGATALYIGLFGTVIGIIKAFSNIGKSGAGGITAVVGPIAEALVCTAAGLAVAIPAVVMYNYFSRRRDLMVSEMQLTASELLGQIKHNLKSGGK